MDSVNGAVKTINLPPSAGPSGLTIGFGVSFFCRLRGKLMSIVPGLTRFREMTKQMAETCQIDSQTRGTTLIALLH